MSDPTSAPWVREHVFPWASLALQRAQGLYGEFLAESAWWALPLKCALAWAGPAVIGFSTGRRLRREVWTGLPWRHRVSSFLFYVPITLGGVAYVSHTLAAVHGVLVPATLLVATTAEGVAGVSRLRCGPTVVVRFRA
ncbi:hypothetical protein SAMN05421869_1458 [Nonomuraea jiangxiensis]|uniref:Uncharacterized protein n=1 Tax=Nonomuraea jiangxiensis TaxID=633440 RepID=A0A1G9TJL4_9ACTN|nr:hypothetical protein SAMN05421869_1458 [Nonomuraea jiangxiensis]